MITLWPLGSLVGGFKDLEKECVSTGLGMGMHVSGLLPAPYNRAQAIHPASVGLPIPAHLTGTHRGPCTYRADGGGHGLGDTIVPNPGERFPSQLFGPMFVDKYP